jgi:hypothetical protein
MAKFDLKKAILENKATFFSSLTEGQFSWMTQDTGQQIGSQDENMIPVYMFDDKGKYYYENNYDGYGEFGGKDYYDLVAEMNGYTADDAEKFGGTFGELRGVGIKLAFGELEPKNGGPVLFPALVTKPDKFNYKSHNFAVEAETDPNQSWYEPEEDEESDYDSYFGDMDREEDYEDEELDENKETKPTTKMKKSDLKAKIKEMIVAEYERDVDYTDETAGYDFLAELEGMLNEAEGLTPLQDYVYQYEIEISGEDKAQEFLDDIKKLNTPQDVYDYYAYDRDWQGSMDDDLENIFRQVKRKFKNLNEASEFDTNKPARIKEFIIALNRLVDEYHSELYLNDDLFAAISMVIKAAQEEAMNLSEADETEKDTAEVDTTDVAVDDTETIDTETEVEVDPNVKAVQDALTQAQVAAQKLGDPKLTDQIGNTITFFTREHVVEKPKSAVAEGEEMEEAMIPIEPGDNDYDIGYKSFFSYENKIGGFGIEDIKKAGKIIANKVKNDNKIQNTDDFFRGFMDSWRESDYDETADKEDMYESKKPVNEVMFPMLKRILK